MIKKYKVQFSRVKDFISEGVRANKILTILLSAFILIAFLTGVIVAIKTRSFSSAGVFINSDKCNQITSNFWARLLSMLIIFLILFGCSFLPVLFPITAIFLSYRAYLLGLNICLMIIWYGFSGVVVAIIVALPCQILALAILLLFHILALKTSKDFKAFGGCRIAHERLVICVVTLSLLLLLCLIESLLLAIFSPKIILVL